jgi:hypothetical protein
VRVHLRNAWHQIPPPSVYPCRPGRHADRVSGTNSRDPVASDEHRPALEQPLTIHRHHGHVSEGDESGGVGEDLRDDNTDYEHGDQAKCGQVRASATASWASRAAITE